MPLGTLNPDVLAAASAVYRDGNNKSLVAPTGSVISLQSGAELEILDGARVTWPLRIVTADATLTAAYSGLTVVVNAADKVITLPATSAGLRFRVVATATAAASGSVGTKVSPVAADKIMGNGFTSADNKGAINTAATDAEGNWIELTGDGVDGWFITGIGGTWAREA